MGVHKLWSLLESEAKATRLEALQGQKLAIDASIWLYQFQKAMRDKDGNSIKGCHIAGFVRRIIKLLYLGIYPVFVFDGGVVPLKRRTLMERKTKRDRAHDSMEKIAERILNAQLKLHALGGDLNAEAPMEDEFKLPVAPSRNKLDARIATSSEIYEFIHSQQQSIDFSKVDIDSLEFKALPLPLQHEIILDLKNKSRTPSEMRVRDMVEQSSTALDFSNNQLKNLIHRATLTDRYHKSLKTDVRRVAGTRQRDYVLKKVDSSKKVVGSLKGLEGFANESLNQTDEPVPGYFGLEDSIPDYVDLEKYCAESPVEEPRNEEGSGFSVNDFVYNWKRFAPPGFEKAYPDGIIADMLSKSEAALGVLLKIVDGRIVIGKDSSIHQYYKDFINKCIELQKAGVSVESFEIPSANETLDSSLKIELENQTNKQDLHAVKETVVILSDFESESSENFEELNLSMEPVFPKNEPGTINIETETLPYVSRAGSPLSPIIVSREEDPLISPVEKESGSEFRSFLTNQSLIPSNIPKNSDEGKEHNENAEKESQSLFKSFLTSSLETNQTKPGKILSEIVVADDIDLEVPLDIQENVEFVPNGHEIPEINNTNGLKLTIESNTTSNSFSSPEIITPGEITNEVVAENVIESEKSKGIQLLTEMEEEENQEVPLLLDTERAQVLEDLHFDSSLSREQNITETENLIQTLKQSRNQQIRDFEGISTDMVKDIQELLKEFGIPYVVAATEAESQCAYLYQHNLVDGIVTDDSDVFLFGGSNVYRNLFDQRKECECFRVENFMNLGLKREHLVQMAYLLGSDYTIGVKGLGPVSSIEIVTCWPGERVEGLSAFKKWVLDLQNGIEVELDSDIKKRLVH